LFSLAVAMALPVRSHLVRGRLRARGRLRQGE